MPDITTWSQLTIALKSKSYPFHINTYASYLDLENTQKITKEQAYEAFNALYLIYMRFMKNAQTSVDESSFVCHGGEYLQDPITSKKLPAEVSLEESPTKKNEYAVFSKTKNVYELTREGGIIVLKRFMGMLLAKVRHIDVTKLEDLNRHIDHSARNSPNKSLETAARTTLNKMAEAIRPNRIEEALRQYDDQHHTIFYQDGREALHCPTFMSKTSHKFYRKTANSTNVVIAGDSDTPDVILSTQPIDVFNEKFIGCDQTDNGTLRYGYEVEHGNGLKQIAAKTLVNAAIESLKKRNKQLSNKYTRLKLLQTKISEVDEYNLDQLEQLSLQVLSIANTHRNAGIWALGNTRSYTAATKALLPNGKKAIDVILNKPHHKHTLRSKYTEQVRRLSQRNEQTNDSLLNEISNTYRKLGNTAALRTKRFKTPLDRQTTFWLETGITLPVGSFESQDSFCKGINQALAKKTNLAQHLLTNKKCAAVKQQLSARINDKAYIQVKPLIIGKSLTSVIVTPSRDCSIGLPNDSVVTLGAVNLVLDDEGLIRICTKSNISEELIAFFRLPGHEKIAFGQQLKTALENKNIPTLIQTLSPLFCLLNSYTVINPGAAADDLMPFLCRLLMEMDLKELSNDFIDECFSNEIFDQFDQSTQYSLTAIYCAIKQVLTTVASGDESNNFEKENEVFSSWLRHAAPTGNKTIHNHSVSFVGKLSQKQQGDSKIPLSLGKLDTQSPHMGA